MRARELLSSLTGAGLSVAIAGDLLIVSPRERITTEQRAAIKASKSDLLALLRAPAVANDESQAPATAASRSWPILVAMGLDESRAERLCEWLRSRSIECDDRRICVECEYLSWRNKACRHPELLEIQAPRDLGALATTPQHCPGFKESQAAAESLAAFLEGASDA